MPVVHALCCFARFRTWTEAEHVFNCQSMPLTNVPSQLAVPCQAYLLPSRMRKQSTNILTSLLETQQYPRHCTHRDMVTANFSMGRNAASLQLSFFAAKNLCNFFALDAEAALIHHCRLPPTRSLGISLNSVPCFKKTFPAV